MRNKAKLGMDGAYGEEGTPPAGRFRRFASGVCRFVASGMVGGHRPFPTDCCSRRVQRSCWWLQSDKLACRRSCETKPMVLPSRWWAHGPYCEGTGGPGVRYKPNPETPESTLTAAERKGYGRKRGLCVCEKQSQSPEQDMGGTPAPRNTLRRHYEHARLHKQSQFRSGDLHGNPGRAGTGTPIAMHRDWEPTLALPRETKPI